MFLFKVIRQIYHKLIPYKLIICRIVNDIDQWNALYLKLNQTCGFNQVWKFNSEIFILILLNQYARHFQFISFGSVLFLHQRFFQACSWPPPIHVLFLLL